MSRMFPVSIPEVSCQHHHNCPPYRVFCVCFEKRDVSIEREFVSRVPLMKSKKEKVVETLDKHIKRHSEGNRIADAGTPRGNGPAASGLALMSHPVQRRCSYAPVLHSVAFFLATTSFSATRILYQRCVVSFIDLGRLLHSEHSRIV